MFSSYADKTHEAQAREFIAYLGEFVIAFERVCEAMRQSILLVFKKEGLRNQALAQVLVADRTASHLRELLGQLYACLSDQDEADQREVATLLKRVGELSTFRNQLLHSCWGLGDKASPVELIATAFKLKANQKSGAYAEILGFSASYIQEKIAEATAIQVLLDRLGTCLLQRGFKVEAEFGRTL